MPATPHTRLAPLLTDRLRALLGARGWPRALALRRTVSVLLIALSGALVLRPAAAHDHPTGHELVTTRDLPAGHTLAAGDVALRELPIGLVPTSALSRPSAAIGQVLSSSVRAGEPLTDVRLLGPADTALTAHVPGAMTVPVRLADAGVADLLHPGSAVDVVTSDVDNQANPVLASDAIVVAVRADDRTDEHGADHADDQSGRLVLLALPKDAATRVAASSLQRPVTVTLR